MEMIFNSRYYFGIERLSIIETTQRGNPFFKFLMFEPYWPQTIIVVEYVDELRHDKGENHNSKQ